MQAFLIKVEIVNSEVEYRDWALVRAETMGEAEALAQTQVDKDNAKSFTEEESKYWTYGESNAIVKLRGVEPIDDEEEQVLQKYGIAYFINEDEQL